VLYLGEINDSQRAAWSRAIEVFDEGGQPADSWRSRPPKRDDVARRNGMMPPAITR